MPKRQPDLEPRYNLNGDSLPGRRTQISWCFYDFANSPFSSLVVTFVFAAYFTQSVALNETLGMAQWARAMTIAGLVIAICSPICGAIADTHGKRKPWLFCFTLLTIFSSAMLWFVQPDSNYVLYTLVCVTLGVIGLEVGMVFYNAMLPDLAEEKMLGRISGWAWGFGYVGGLCCLMIALVVFILPETPPFGLDPSTSEQVRICGPLVAAWIAVFCLPLFFWVPDRSRSDFSIPESVRLGIKTLGNTLKQIRKYKNIAWYLLARMFYTDGINTLFAFGGIYAAGTFHMDLSQVLIFGIAMNIGAGVGAMLFAWVDDLIGSKRTVLLSLFSIVILGSGIILTHTKWIFWFLALIASAFIGPVQSASRSLMARIAPRELMTEMFGLYALVGRVTAFLGPWLLGLVTLHFHSQRAGMSTIFIFLILGGALLFRVDSRRVMA